MRMRFVAAVLAAGLPMCLGAHAWSSSVAACDPSDAFVNRPFWFRTVGADPSTGNVARITFAVRGPDRHRIVVKHRVQGQDHVVARFYGRETEPAEPAYYDSPGGDIVFEFSRCKGQEWVADSAFTSVDFGSDVVSTASTGIAEFSVAFGPGIRRPAAEQPQTPGVTRPAPAQHGFHEAYFVIQHNTYENGSTLTGWLDSGLRSVELDIIDRGDWHEDANGPYVSHDGSIDNRNCSAADDDRLGHCLTDIVNWLSAHPGSGPILVFVDLKPWPDPIGAWHGDELDVLDRWIAGKLGGRMFTGDALYRFAAGTPWSPGGKPLRQAVSERGWPTLQSIGDRIIVAYTGGVELRVNQTQDGGLEHMLDRSKRLPNGFFCPDLDSGIPEILPGGEVEGMDRGRSQYVVCSNLEAREDYQRIAQVAADQKQIIHLFGSHVFGDASYPYNYIAVAHGISAIGRDAGSTSTFGGSIPLVGLRRSVPGVVFLQPVHAPGACVDVEGAEQGNGTKVHLRTCNSQNNQRFEYTADGRLRPLHAANRCVDIEGGSAEPRKIVHLWACDDGSSERWMLNETGMFASMSHLGMCLTAAGGAVGSGTALVTDPCTGARHQRFSLVPSAPRSECWVRVFEDENFADDTDIIFGPGRWPNMRNLPGALKGDWGDEIDSIQMGARARAQFWEDENFGDATITLQPGQSRQNLRGDPDLGDNIDSMEITCI